MNMAPTPCNTQRKDHHTTDLFVVQYDFLEKTDLESKNVSVSFYPHTPKLPQFYPSRGPGEQPLFLFHLWVNQLRVLKSHSHESQGEVI